MLSFENNVHVRARFTRVHRECTAGGGMFKEGGKYGGFVMLKLIRFGIVGFICKR